MALLTSKSGKHHVYTFCMHLSLFICKRCKSTEAAYCLKLICRKKFGTISQIQSIDEDGPIPALDKNETKPPVAANDMIASSNLKQQEPPSHASVSGDISNAENANVNTLIQRKQSRLLEEADIVARSMTDSVDAVVVNLSNAQIFEPEEGVAGRFFSIHSSAKQRIQRVHEMEVGQNKSCWCCAHSVATSNERWYPYKPGVLL